MESQWNDSFVRLEDGERKRQQSAGGCSWNNEITIQQFFNGGKMHRLREGDRV